MYDLSGSYIFMLKANENGMNMKKDRGLRALRPFFFPQYFTLSALVSQSRKA